MRPPHRRLSAVGDDECVAFSPRTTGRARRPYHRCSATSDESCRLLPEPTTQARSRWQRRPPPRHAAETNSVGHHHRATSFFALPAGLVGGDADPQAAMMKAVPQPSCSTSLLDSSLVAAAASSSRAEPPRLAAERSLPLNGGAWQRDALPCSTARITPPGRTLQQAECGPCNCQDLLQGREPNLPKGKEHISLC